ncbi:MAG: thioesterase [bacterium]|nr:thioesterase [bacterium]
MKKIRLFCFPYAGGSAAVYSKWKDGLDRCIHLRPVEMAGRGRRIGDSLYKTVQDAVDDIIKMIRFELTDAPYAFYGHSLGALTAYLTAQKIKEKRYPGPAHIFFSGRGAPHIRREDKEPYHTLPEDEFREKIMDLGGTPPEFFQLPELLEILLPLLRNDFKLSWDYRHTGEIKPLDCDIDVLTGKDEDLTLDQIHGWRHHTRRTCTFRSFDGGHFFLNNSEQKEKILNLLNTLLLDLAARRIPISA